nr:MULTISPECIES: chitooligosaccharide deacetylase NodB [Protofrankia]
MASTTTGTTTCPQAYDDRRTEARRTAAALRAHAGTLIATATMTIRSRAPVSISTPLRLESEPGQIDSRKIRIEEGSRDIFLTFDDEPNPFCTPQVLDVLAEHRVVATFCVIGEYAAKHPELIRRIATEGHGLANHTMTHRDLSRCEPGEVRREISDANKVIRTVCPQACVHYLRAPYGAWTGEARAAALFGLEPLNWSVDPRDWSRPGANVIVETVLTCIRPGGVILLRGGCPADEWPSGSRTGLRERTVIALRRLIPALHEYGFVFQPLPAPSVHSPISRPV